MGLFVSGETKDNPLVSQPLALIDLIMWADAAQGVVGTTVHTLAERWLWRAEEVTAFLDYLHTQGVCVVKSAGGYVIITFQGVANIA